MPHATREFQGPRTPASCTFKPAEEGAPDEGEVIQREGQRGIEVTVLRAPGDQRTERLADRLRTAGGRLTAYVSQSGTERRVVPLTSVASIRPDADHVLVHMVDGSTPYSVSRLLELKVALQQTDLVRVSRREVVNLDNVRTIRPEFGSRLVLGL